MSSRAKLPSAQIEENLKEALDLMDRVVVLMEENEQDEAWVIWNLGGAAFDKPQFPGPGGCTAEDFCRYTRSTRRKMQKVLDSFEHRRRKEAERAQARAVRRLEDA